jgi:hypothetical protein
MTEAVDAHGGESGTAQQEAEGVEIHVDRTCRYRRFPKLTSQFSAGVVAGRSHFMLRNCLKHTRF